MHQPKKRDGLPLPRRSGFHLGSGAEEISSRLNKYGWERKNPLFQDSASAYASGSSWVRIQRPKSLVYDIQDGLEPGWEDFLKMTQPSTAC
ncbi:hypothetical protein [Arthrobacter sp. 2MCAF14]|uniref:hypothetical protein n=1 Tax=Arthrobacter sp. 2MCAF14 TaxID=3232982 RepID=UPI003F93CD26